MTCSKCGKDNFILIEKEQSQLDKKNDKITSFIFCKNCEPVFASLYLLEDGFKVACKILDQNQKEDLSHE